MQLVRIPPSYVCQDVASTPIETGPFADSHAAIVPSVWPMFSKETMRAPKLAVPLLHAGTSPPPET